MRIRLLIAHALLGLLFLAANANSAGHDKSHNDSDGSAFAQAPSVAQMRSRYAKPPSRFLAIDGVEMHFRDSGGDGPVVLLLPGHMGSLRMYDGWLPFLNPAFRTIGLDWPPYGLSIPDPSGVYSSVRGAELVIGFLEKMNLSSVHLVGTSNGATVAAHVAATRPELVERLALSTFPLGAPPKRKISVELIEQAKLHMGNTIYRPPSLYRAILEDIFHDPAKVMPALVRQYTDMNNHPGGYAAQGAYVQSNLKMYASDDWPELYQQISAPTLLQWGDGGVVLPPYTAQSAVDALPNAPVTLLRYPESGHMPMLEEPEKTAKDLVAFLNGVYDAEARPAGD